MNSDEQPGGLKKRRCEKESRFFIRTTWLEGGTESKNLSGDLSVIRHITRHRTRTRVSNNILSINLIPSSLPIRTLDCLRQRVTFPNGSFHF